MTWLLHHPGWLVVGLLCTPSVLVLALMVKDGVCCALDWARSLRRQVRAARDDNAFADEPVIGEDACALTGPAPIQPDEIRWRTDDEWAALEDLFRKDYDAWEATK